MSKEIEAKRTETPDGVPLHQVVEMLAARMECAADYHLRSQWDGGPTEYIIKTTTAETLRMCAKDIRAEMAKHLNVPMRDAGTKPL